MAYNFIIPVDFAESGDQLSFALDAGTLDSRKIGGAESFILTENGGGWLNGGYNDFSLGYNYQVQPWGAPQHLNTWTMFEDGISGESIIKQSGVLYTSALQGNMGMDTSASHPDIADYDVDARPYYCYSNTNLAFEATYMQIQWKLETTSSVTIGQVETDGGTVIVYVDEVVSDFYQYDQDKGQIYRTKLDCLEVTTLCPVVTHSVLYDEGEELGLEVLEEGYWIEGYWDDGYWIDVPDIPGYWIYYDDIPGYWIQVDADGNQVAEGEVPILLEEGYWTEPVLIDEGYTIDVPDIPGYWVPGELISEGYYLEGGYPEGFGEFTYLFRLKRKDTSEIYSEWLETMVFDSTYTSFYYSEFVRDIYLNEMSIPDGTELEITVQPNTQVRRFDNSKEGYIRLTRTEINATWQNYSYLSPESIPSIPTELNHWLYGDLVIKKSGATY